LTTVQPIADMTSIRWHRAGFWNVDLNRLENEINAFLATLPSNAVKYVQSAAPSTRTGDTDQMQTDYLVTVWYEGEPKNLRPKNQRGGEIQIRGVPGVCTKNLDSGVVVMQSTEERM
jgi:hypothetical protein